MNFTAEQLAAVDIQHRHLDACVVAGPGSGKTTVLVEYFQRLVEAGADPQRILAITFTEKAAGNMRTRLAQAFHDPQTRARLERAWVSTVHGFCGRLLRENAIVAGVDPEFYIADERESWRMQLESMNEAMDQLFREQPAAVRAMIRGLSSIEFEDAMRSAYDAMRCAGVGVAELDGFPAPPGVRIDEIADTLRALCNENVRRWKESQLEEFQSALEGARRIVEASTTLEALHATSAFACNRGRIPKKGTANNLLERLQQQVKGVANSLITEHYSRERTLLLEVLRRFDRLYRARKRQAGALDFADLEEFTVRLLSDRPETRAKLRAQFDHILMDEFQDTNGQQARLLELIRPTDRFYSVGDVNQSIFGFRHAEPQGFLDYRDQVQQRGRRVIELTGNFRSRPQILSAVETITNGLAGIEPRPLVACREFPDAPSYSVEVLYTPAGESVEAKRVAGRIVDLVAEFPDFSFQDVAVLVRNTEVLPAFTDAFDEAGIPYVVNRGKGFFESREVNDLSHLLRVIANPRDEISLATVLRSPLVGVSDEAILQLRVIGEAHGGNMGPTLMRLSPEAAADFDPADYAALVRFRDRLKRWRMRRDSVTFDRLLLEAIDDCGYPAAPNLDKFLAQARDAAARMPLAEFVEDLALVRASNPREPDEPLEDSTDAVKVMTVHSAKGLEFPIVFLAAMHKGINTSLSVVEFSRQFGLGASWREPATNKEMNDLVQEAIEGERDKREEEESSRLLYVAMTRAEQHLVLSFSGKKKQNWGKTLIESLDLKLDKPFDEIVTRAAPDGKEWKLRIHVADEAPELKAAKRGAASAQRLEFLPAPNVTGQQDAHATVTGLSRFAACARKYYLAEYVGFEGRARKLEDASGNSKLTASELGLEVHALLAGGASNGASGEASRLANVFQQSPLGRRVSRAARVEREFDFVMSIEDLVIRGQVDLWFEEGGELIIVDYKTDAVTAVDAHQRAEDYLLQLKLYALAVEQAAGRPPDRAFLHFLRPNTLIEVDLTPSLLETPEQIVRDFQLAQANLDFPLNEGAHCRNCEFYRDLCPASYTIIREKDSVLS